MKPLVPLRTRAVQSGPFCANYEAGHYLKWFVEHASLSSCRRMRFGKLYAISAATTSQPIGSWRNSGIIREDSRALLDLRPIALELPFCEDIRRRGLFNAASRGRT